MREFSAFDVVGLQFKHFLKQYRFPTIDELILKEQDYELFIAQLYKVPTEQKKLRKLIIELILQGQIEEVQEQRQDLVIIVRFEYKKEVYLLELNFNLLDYQWTVIHLQYCGEAVKKKSLLPILLTLFLLTLGLAMYILHEVPQSTLIKAKEQVQVTISDFLSQKVSFEIESQMSLEDITDMFVSKGLARNKKELVEILELLNIDESHFIANSYRVDKHITYMELINLVTTSQR